MAIRDKRKGNIQSLFAIDIDKRLVEVVNLKAVIIGLNNIKEKRDFTDNRL